MRCRRSRPCPLSPAPRRTGADRSRTPAWWSVGSRKRGSQPSSLDSFDFAAIPSSTRPWSGTRPFRVRDPRRENVIAVGNGGTGKAHIALGIGLAACQKGLSVGFYTAAALVHELLEARDEAVASSAAAGRRIQAPDHRRAWICPSLPDRGQYCCSKYSANATSAVQPSSHQTCRSTNGPACSGPSV